MYMRCLMFIKSKTRSNGNYPLFPNCPMSYKIHLKSSYYSSGTKLVPESKYKQHETVRDLTKHMAQWERLTLIKSSHKDS